MTFLYYATGQQRISMERIQAMGLGYAFDETPEQGDTIGGPSESGHVFTSGTPRYHEPEQTWRKIPQKFTGEEEVWVGFENANRPTPKSLARSSQLDGDLVTFDDGSQWTIPVARRWSVDEDEVWTSRITLPPKLTLTDDGEWVANAIKDRYAELWRMATGYETAYAEAYCKAAADRTDGGNFNFTFEFTEWNELAIEALKTNYYVSDPEIDLLGVLDYETRAAIVDTVIDENSWKAWTQQKKTSDRVGLSSSNGPGVVDAGTTQRRRPSLADIRAYQRNLHLRA